MLLREKKSLKVWELQGRLHPLLMKGAGQWTRCGTNECICGWDSSGFKVSMLRPAAETDCSSWLQLFCDLNFAFCGWRHSHISWFGNFLLCRPIRNIIQLSLNTECEQWAAWTHVGTCWTRIPQKCLLLSKSIPQERNLHGFVRDT